MEMQDAKQTVGNRNRWLQQCLSPVNFLSIGRNVVCPSDFPAAGPDYIETH
jgi:hypothetical protein